MRIISQSEIEMLLDCPAKHGFAFGRLAGFPIEAKVKPARLREGIAWGRAVQLFHSLAIAQGVEAAGQAGARALEASLAADALVAQEAGVYVPEEHDELLARMLKVFSWYCVTTRPLNLIDSEVQLQLEIGNGWFYGARLDGVHEDEEGQHWLVEFKFRQQFLPYEQIVLQRQLRWYALAYLAHHGLPVAGVIVDEGHNVELKPVRFNKDGKVSAVQSCTLEEYMAACAEHKTPTNENTVRNLATKTSHQRHEIQFRPEELAEARLEIESAARMIWFYEQGTLMPLRHPSRQRCGGCMYLQICPTPDDARLRDALYQPSTYEPAKETV